MGSSAVPFHARDLRAGDRLCVALFLTLSGCASTVATSPQPPHIAQPAADPAVELRRTGAGYSEPSVLIDSTWLSKNDAVKYLTEAVYTSFPSEARVRRKHIVRIVPREVMGLPEDRAPVLLFHRGELVIVLDTDDARWSQYTYQLSHEMGHALMASPAIDGIKSWTAQLQMPNKWLEEALCELASLYALRQVAEMWESEPPFAGARAYARNFRTYSLGVHAKAESVPDNLSFQDWLLQNGGHLREHPYDRPKNAAVAIRLLPLFTRRPSLWTCATYLNANTTQTDQEDLSSLIAAWKARAPQSCGTDIDAFAEVLGVN